MAFQIAMTLVLGQAKTRDYEKLSMWFPYMAIDSRTWRLPSLLLLTSVADRTILSMVTYIWQEVKEYEWPRTMSPALSCG